MPRMLDIVALALAFSTLVGISAFKREWYRHPLMRALALLLLGIVVGTFPRSLGWQNERVLIGASIVSILASLTSAAAIVRIHWSFGSHKG